MNTILNVLYLNDVLNDSNKHIIYNIYYKYYVLGVQGNINIFDISFSCYIT